MNRVDFYDWKRHPVTEAVFSQLQERINFFQAKLLEQAGRDPIEDARASGAAMAIRDVLEIEYEEETQ